MGSSESTGRSNGTEDEEERHPENNSPGGGGGSMGAGTAVAIAAAGTAVAAWGISRIISGSRDSESKDRQYEANIFTDRQHESMAMANAGAIAPKSWSPPPPGKLKMNTDGAVPHPVEGGDRIQRGLSGYAGILRNHRGEWVGGFQGFLGETDSLTAELHGIHKGLKFLDKHGLRGSILESDCQAAVQWVNRPDHRLPRKSIQNCGDIIMESRRLAYKNAISVELIKGVDGDAIKSKRVNRCADKLAGLAVRKEQEYMEIRDVPDEIKDLYNKDLMAIVPDIW